MTAQHDAMLVVYHGLIATQIRYCDGVKSDDFAEPRLEIAQRIVSELVAAGLIGLCQDCGAVAAAHGLTDADRLAMIRTVPPSQPALEFT